MINTFQSMYYRLTDFILQNINLNFSTILEVGCGRGQLTIPFAYKIMNYLKNFKLIAYDLSGDPYSNCLDYLKKKIQQERLEDSIVVMQGDVRDMNTIEDESFDLIFSNELLCELNRNGLEKALIEFHRVLRDNGQMIHAELMPIPENIPQKLFIEADMHSLETSSPKPDWFSPYSDEIAAILHKIGFNNITIKYFETGIELNFKEAVEALQNWSVDPEYIKANKENLRKYGLEYPMEHVIFCQK